MGIKTDKLVLRTSKKPTCPSNSNFESGLHYFHTPLKNILINLQVAWDSGREHKCLKHGQSEIVPWQLFSKVFGEIAGWKCKKQVISPRVADGRTAKTYFYENLAGHFYHLAYLPMAFLPSGIFTNVIFTISHFYHWHFYHLVYLSMTFLPSGIFTNDIFTIWHIYQ